MSVTHLFVNPIADELGFLGTKPSDWNDNHVVSIENADVAAAAGIVESKLSLNFPTHAPVTLGISNGLVLAGQALSMNLAGANSTGTLSAQDWNTFNGKQSALTFPLVASLGGTSVNNSGTFTNHSNSTIIGGGVISLGGFTLTVPATGTAALLATANVFTVGQMVDGSADAIQLRVQGHSTQTANLATFESSSAGVLVGISGLGGITQSSAGTMPTLLNSVTANNTGTGSYTAQSYFAQQTAATAQNVAAFNSEVQVRAIGANASVGTQASGFKIRMFLTGNGTFLASITAADMISLNKPWADGSGSRIITTLRGLYIDALGSWSGGAAALTKTSLYGIYLENQSGAATNNYAIYTNLGDVSLGDDLILRNDSDKIRLGALSTGDLQLYHDGTNSFIYNDTGILKIQDAGSGIWIGTATTELIGFYGVAASAQAAGIADADGTLADITTKFNSLLAKLETYGLLAAA